jgi:hypothetical protein
MVEFAETYREARERFLEAARAFESDSGRRCALERHAMSEPEDLTIDVVHFEPRGGRRLFVATSGLHGIEGYAGNAIQRALLGGALRRLPANCGIALVHALNPWGMTHWRRANPNNVDLNRNFALEGDSLYASDNPGYRGVGAALAPREPCRGGLGPRRRLFGRLLAALLRAGYAPLKQALLQGQYVAPEGIFYGGAEPQREALTFARIFEPLAERYDEILLTDLHTGYGERGRAVFLWSHADSPGLLASGDRSANGVPPGYAVTGDLVGYCRRAAMRARSGGTFDGGVLELGTTGLSLWSQLRDLETVVSENQLHRYGARDEGIERAVRTAFRELFCPADPTWRRDALAAAVAAIEALLAQRGWLGAA